MHYGKVEAARKASDDRARRLKTLIWTYFFLLIFEGALRKWILPRFSNYLLLIRDPVLLLCYWEAFRTGHFRWNRWTTGVACLGVVSFAITLFSSLIGESRSSLFINLFGFRANFLHIPLIFVIGSALRRSDVIRMGRVLLILAVPMSVLVFAQYNADPSAWINAGAGGQGSAQISAAVGGVEKIRAAGTFSFITGLVAFTSLVAAFVFSNLLVPSYNRWMGIAGIIATCALVTFSISRSALFSVVIVGAAAAVSVALNPRLKGNAIIGAILLIPLVLGITRLSSMREASGIIRERIDSAEGLKVGVFDRFVSDLGEPLRLAGRVPFFGYGLGMGTNAAAGVTSEAMFSEIEWGRVVVEMGPILGFAYIVLRTTLAFGLCRVGVFCLRSRSNPLPLLLFSACALRVVLGAFGQPTELGFAVFGAGLCLAAARE